MVAVPAADGPAVVEMVPLVDLDAASARAARSVYEEAFPARQRTPFSEILADAREGTYKADAIIVGGRPAGICFVSRLPSVGWWFLEYLAIDRALRSRGVGRAAWEVLTETAREAGAQGVVLEVEDPQIAGHEREDAVRRIAFYQRCGAALLPVPGYVVPDVGGDGTEKLLLMAAPANVAGRADVLPRLVRALYEEGYGMGSDDPLMADALASIGV